MATENNQPVMRIFEFLCAADDMQSVLDAGRKNIETSVRDEPGVLSIYCAIDTDNPTKLYVVEVYRDQAAHQAHVQSAHFKAFTDAIHGKVISRRVVETAPVCIGAKALSWP